ncbi:FtsX-like permease family protein, partial [candidate division KSB1 bacterium]
VGKSITLELGEDLVKFEVTGVLKDIPVNSHVHFDVLISISTYPETQFAQWRSNYLYTYVLIRDGTDKNILEEKLKIFVDKYLKVNYGDLLVGNADIHDVLKMELFPVTDIHLHPKINQEIEAQGNITSVYIFSSIALLILVIACINFMNLSTARANKRAAEVGLRKTIGANKGQLRAQFLAESVFLAIIALLLSVVLTSGFIHLYNYVFNDTLSVSLLLQAKNLIILLGITAAAGFFSGLYPAFYMTRFEAVQVLKGSVLSGKGKSAFRRNMVVIQFIISITMIIGMFTIYKQMRYVQTRDLGFDKNNLVVLSTRGRSIAQGFEGFRNELMRNPKIESVSASFNSLGQRTYSNTNIRDPLAESDRSHSIYTLFVGYDFFTTHKMDVIEGRGFSREFISDTSAVLLNEAAAKKFGWNTDIAVGRQVYAFRNSPFNVIGVVKDFNYRSLRQEIEPLIILLAPSFIRNITVRIQPDDIAGTLGFIRQRWAENYPSEQYNYSFMDESIDQLYENDRKMQNISFMFSCFSIFVACLGLFGLAAYTAEVKMKEVSIRKVLGASIPDIFRMLSKEFIILVIISTVISWPIAYYAANKWLQDFVYKTNIGIMTFITASIAALIITFITVSFQAIKAATSNPIDSLRNE